MPLLINVKNANPLAFDDAFVLMANSGAVALPVTTNDLTDVRVSRVDQVDQHLGSATVGHDGSYISYKVVPNTWGTDRFAYAVTNGSGVSDLAWVTVEIIAPPTVTITEPNAMTQAGPFTNGSIALYVAGTSQGYGCNVTNIDIYANNVKFGSTSQPDFRFAWNTSVDGVYTFKAVATDARGQTNASAPVSIITFTVTNALTAGIANLPAVDNGLGADTYPVVREGRFDLQGLARNTNAQGSLPVAYQLLVHSFNDPDAVLANVTPNANAAGLHEGSDTNGDLGEMDLTSLPNGIYSLELLVYGGGDVVSVTAGFQLESNLKIGQFSFSEQDLAIPVNGIPLTVTRTYSSFNQRAADFGFSWTYALNDMDVQLDDTRETVTLGGSNAKGISLADDDTGDNGLPREVSIRTGGGWDVTLTLPDGRRTTFAFYYTGNWPELHARWQAPPGVQDKLTMKGDNNIVFGLSGSLTVPTWADSDFAASLAPLENQDIRGWILETPDGTKYEITRGAAENILWERSPGEFVSARACDAQPKLTKIIQRSLDEIHIDANEISHWAGGTNKTRSTWFERDFAGRIVAIRDPNAGSNGWPVMKYIYNRDTGNLIQVYRLQDRTAGTYTVTKYHYDHPKFPHYLTSIEDPRGVPLARNEYDDSGRLTAVVDADGKRTQFVHNTTNNVEIVTDRLGNTNTFVYDPRGNVTAITNALNQVTTMQYDDFNNKTNEVVFLAGQPYATNNYLYATNLLLASINPLGYSNTFLYGPRERLEVSTDACGFSTTNFYDDNTDLLIATRDAAGNFTSNYYNAGLLVGTRDALGNMTTNSYDPLGNLTGTALLQANSLVILSTNSFAYDLNGNQTNAVAWRTNRTAGGWLGATNTTIYDAQNRVVQTLAPDGGTNRVAYNVLGKQDYTVDVLGRTNRFDYDAQGRLFKTTYADGSVELTIFDAEGRRASSVDRGWRTNNFQYDALGRLTNTIYADNTSNRTFYDGLGRLQFSVDARGVTNAYGYDLGGRRVAVTNALGTSVVTTNFFGYDANGNQPYITNALGAVTTNVLDALNRVTEVRYADGTKKSTGYDAVGRRVAETNQDGIVTRFGYDGAGRLLAVTNALGTAQPMFALYEYDEAGNQTAQIDALFRTNRFECDNLGRRTRRTQPGLQFETFGYDLSGNLIRHTNFNGVVITNQYDLLGRLTNRSSINGYGMSYAYSVTGQRTNMTDLSGTTAYTYDSRDRLTNKMVAWTGGPTIALIYRYDASGNLTNLWSTNISAGTSIGVTNVLQYDALSRLTNVLGRGGVSAGYSFDVAGNLQTMRYGNGVTNLYQYDRLSRLTNATWKLNTTALGDFTYKLGLSGHRTNLSETVNTTSRAYAWQYDALQRLTNETVTGASPTGTLGYGYDGVGNRTNRSGSLAALGGQTPTYNTNDWLTTDVYDANGNTRTNASNQPYFYDVENHLTNFNNGVVLVAYNGDGARVKKTVGGTNTYYLVDDRNPSGYAQVLEEWTASGGSPSLSRSYNHGLSLIAQSEAGGTVYYFGYDGHGSTRFLMNGSTVTNVFAYDAYGTLVGSNTTAQTAYLYCGEQFDGNLGFYYLRARFLNPNTGRFWTMDSYEGNNSDPLSLHKYLYAHDNPINGLDPSGHETLLELAESMAERITIATRHAVTVLKWYNRAKTIVNFMNMTVELASEWNSGELGHAVKEKIRDARKEWKRLGLRLTAEAALKDLEENLEGRLIPTVLAHWPMKLASTYGKLPDRIGIDMPVIIPMEKIPVKFGRLPKTNMDVDLIFGAGGSKCGRVTGVEVAYGKFWQQLWRMDFHPGHADTQGDYAWWPSGEFHYHVPE